jgi:hypothetical protein
MTEVFFRIIFDDRIAGEGDFGQDLVLRVPDKTPAKAVKAVDLRLAAPNPWQI